MSQEWFEHFSVLRQAFLKSLLVFTLMTCIAYFFAEKIFHFLTAPILHKLPADNQLVATNLIAILMVQLKIALYVGMIAALPYVFIQLWRFVKPALHAHELSYVKLLWWSLLLGLLGMIFAYTLFLPMLFGFMLSLAPKGVFILPDIEPLVNFTLRMILVCSLLFQIPLLMYLLQRMQILTYEMIKGSRAYVIVLAATLGMLLTPPDVLSQVMLAIPIWGLFELGALMIYLKERQQIISRRAQAHG